MVGHILVTAPPNHALFILHIPFPKPTCACCTATWLVCPSLFVLRPQPDLTSLVSKIQVLHVHSTLSFFNPCSTCFPNVHTSSPGRFAFVARASLLPLVLSQSTNLCTARSRSIRPAHPYFALPSLTGQATPCCMRYMPLKISIFIHQLRHAFKLS